MIILTVWFYKKLLLHLSLEIVLKVEFVTAYKENNLKNLHGTVLEIGSGTGLNIPHYPGEVEQFLLLNPNEGMHNRVKGKVKTKTKIKKIIAFCENIPPNNDSVDFVVSSWALCSFGNVSQSLNEIRRILKPGGKLTFIEHGKARISTFLKCRNF